MDAQKERQLAKLTIAARGVPFTYAKLMKNGGRKSLAFFISFPLAAALVVMVQAWPAVYFIGGMFIGAILRDIGWVRSINSNSSFTDKIIDWDRVDDLAKGID